MQEKHFLEPNSISCIRATCVRTYVRTHGQSLLYKGTRLDISPQSVALEALESIRVQRVQVALWMDGDVQLPALVALVSWVSWQIYATGSSTGSTTLHWCGALWMSGGGGWMGGGWMGGGGPGPIQLR